MPTASEIDALKRRLADADERWRAAPSEATTREYMRAQRAIEVARMRVLEEAIEVFLRGPAL